MNKSITLLVVLLMLAGNIATAQTGSRIIGVGEYRYSGSTYYLADSTKLVWYSNYGGDYDHPTDARKISYQEHINLSPTAINSAEKYTYTFDVNDRVSETLLFYWDGSVYQNSNKHIDSLNAQGMVVKTTSYAWVAGSWVNSDYQDFTYNAAGLRSLTESWYWQSGTGTWQKSLIAVQEFNAAGKRTLFETSTFSGGIWVNQNQTTYDYDASNNLITQTQAIGSGSTWINDARDAYQYDANNNQLIRTTYDWNTGTGAWINKTRELYNYNAGNQRTDWTHQTYSTAWDNAYRYLYTYNTAGLRETYIREDWVAAAWEKTFRNTEVYNANGFSMESKLQYWDDPVWLDTSKTTYTRNSYDQKTLLKKEKYVAGAWEDDGDTRYYYETYTITGMAELPDAIGASVYPNPFTVNTLLDFEQPQSGTATISIYNMQGALVKQVSQHFPGGHNNWLWNGENNSGESVGTGMYFIHIQSAGKFGVQKVVKL